MQLVARKTGAELVVISREGDVLFDASLGMADRAALKRVAAVSSGEAVTGLGRARFGTEPLKAPGLAAAQVLVAFVREPSAPEAAPCPRAGAHRSHDASRRRGGGGRVRGRARRQSRRGVRGRAGARDGPRALGADGRGRAGTHHGRGGRAHRRLQRPRGSLRRGAVELQERSRARPRRRPRPRRVSGRSQPRAAQSAQRHPGLRRRAHDGGRRPALRRGPRGGRADPRIGKAPPRSHQRHPRAQRPRERTAQADAHEGRSRGRRLGGRPRGRGARRLSSGGGSRRRARRTSMRGPTRSACGRC